MFRRARCGCNGAVMAEFLTLATIEHLQGLVDDQIEESLVLDYKASPALSRENARVNELCKDVSSFANSAGGQIVYGIREQDQRPVEIDDGVDGSVITREWIEQTLTTRIQPKIDGLRIEPIRLDPATSQTAYVLTIPAATARAPHMANDRYFRRYNFQSVPMADYEVREAMRRATTPALSLKPTFPTGIHFAQGASESNIIPMRLTIENQSGEPAFHAVGQIYVEPLVKIEVRNDWPGYPPSKEIRGAEAVGVQKLIGSGTTFPIFREFPLSAGEIHLSFPFDHHLTKVNDYVMHMHLFWPGGAWQQRGYIRIHRGNIWYEPHTAEGQS